MITPLICLSLALHFFCFRATDPKSSSKKEGSSSALASPMGRSSGAKPRKLWNGPESMRLELGKSSAQTKSLDSINSMMRNQQAALGRPPVATPSTGRNASTPHSSYRGLNTPIKLDPSPVQSKASAKANQNIANNKRPFPPSFATLARDGKILKSGGKENVAGKRHPCNCKKSKCLKLYCECFSAELFCDGCNCTDCRNNTAFVSVAVSDELVCFPFQCNAYFSFFVS